MIQPAIQKGILFAFFISITLYASAQVKPIRNTEPVSENTNSRKPFRVLTNGKKITVQGTSNISKILVWTASGYRIVEQTNLNTPNYSFDVPVKENIFFPVVGIYKWEKVYGEDWGEISITNYTN